MQSPIDITEEFPRLPRAPIVEAVLDLRVVSSAEWDESSLQSQLEERLPDYPKHDTVQETEVQLSPETGTNVVKDFVHVGLKCQSEDSFYVVQFNKDSFVFSRLKPYENWEKFSREALRLWKIYCELLEPTEIGRIGLRFINRLAIKQGQRIELADYYKRPPLPIEGLNWLLSGYLHRDVLQIPGTPYSVNVIKTVQRTQQEAGLLLDIDVFMQKSLNCGEIQVSKYMDEMRWVKNKAFFSNLTKKALEECK
ncbi:MAG: TIGR04255 family protein [Candidatus Dadabacteria bacterium]|nr:TIGR04255 family protein [Candidatus Dadabacteria bacterium]